MRPLTNPPHPLVHDLEHLMAVPALDTTRTETHTVRPTHGVAAVVAPYGTGKHYRAEIAARGWDCVAVTPADRLLAPMYRGSLDPAGYREVVVHDGDIHATASALKRVGVTIILAGTEIGVPHAEALAHRLGLPGNDPVTSDLRRDKGAMAAALKAAGLDAPRSLSTDSLREALEWADMQPGSEFVLKPADSGGSDGVAFCSSPDAIKAAWRGLHEVPNALGGTNDHLILQERLIGTQYVVNSVSARTPGGGVRHAFTELWADHRTRTGHLYDRLDLLQPYHLIPRMLTQYTARVLDVLGISSGPAHTELMYVPRRGPVLIETGARPEGSYDPVAMREATGSDHVRDAVHAALTGWPALTASGRRPRRFVTKVSLIAPTDGVLDQALLETLLALPTVRGHVGALKPGTPVVRTVDLLTSPGRLTLSADDAAAVDADHQTIRALEADGLYVGASR
ncbi:hypothetical protein AB0F03_37365 [Streptomyces sp. NPDC028722]|uniref:hypothetical protein n=1 Tax=Streptomyces sp. NPDC028722 TaxID=3155016 RepID=UPI0033EB60E9